MNVPSAPADLSKVLLLISGQADRNEDVKLEITGDKQCIQMEQTQGKARGRGMSLAMTSIANLGAASSKPHQHSRVNKWLCCHCDCAPPQERRV